jgi:predicted amidohydrolase YtcJ
MDESELLLTNGRVYTVDENRPWAKAVAMRGGRIAAVGQNDEILALAGPAARIIDLGGHLVLPGLCDAHIHLYDWCVARRQVQLAGCNSLAEMLERIAAWSGRTETGYWLTGRNWNEDVWPEGRRPTRFDLDQVTDPGIPAIFWRTDMHGAVANSAALALAGIDRHTPDPPGGVIGRDDSGRPNGLLWELAINPVMAQMPVPEPGWRDEAILEGIATLHQWGVTAVHDQRMKDQTEGPLALDTYQRLNRSDRLWLRINCNIAAHALDHLIALGLHGGFGDDRLRLGHVKLFADGTMGSQTAWLLDPYEKSDPGQLDEFGVNVTPPEQIAEEIRQAAAAGFPVSVHAIGDQANRVVLDIFEELHGEDYGGRIPHRIEHVQIIHPDDRPRLARLGLTASVQPVHAVDDMELAERVLGLRAARTYNFRSLAESGALLALGSDAPVADPNPFVGIHAALYRQRPERMSRGPWYPDERLTLAQTIYGYTLGAARAAGWQETIGSITIGKRADLVVLDRDLFALEADGDPAQAMAETQVLLTVFDGQIVHTHGLALGI